MRRPHTHRFDLKIFFLWIISLGTLSHAANPSDANSCHIMKNRFLENSIGLDTVGLQIRKDGQTAYSDRNAFDVTTTETIRYKFKTVNTLDSSQGPFEELQQTVTITRDNDGRVVRIEKATRRLNDLSSLHPQFPDSAYSFKYENGLCSAEPVVGGHPPTNGRHRRALGSDSNPSSPAGIPRAFENSSRENSKNKPPYGNRTPVK